MNRRAFSSSLAAAAAVPHVVGAQAMPTITVGSAPVEDILGTLIGEEDGAFRRAGFAVNVQKANSGSAVAAAVIGGSMDIGKTNMLSLVTAHARGIPFTILAPAAIYNADAPAIGLVVPRDSPVRTASDLDDKVIAVPGLDDMSAIGTRNWIDHSGGDSRRAKFVEIPSAAIADAVAAKRIDAGVIDNPSLGQAVARGAVRVAAYPFDSFGRRFVWAAYFTTVAWAEKNRAIADGFKRVIAQTGAYANAHPDATVELLAQFTGIDPSVIRSMTRTTIGTVAEPRLIQPIIDAFAAYHVIPAAFDARELIDQG